MKRQRSNRVFWLLGLAVITALATCMLRDDCTLLTPDQAAYRLLLDEDYDAAAEAFADPMWRGVSIFRQGEFKQAAGVFAGFDTPEAAFNQGNALVMQGRYEEAVARYDRALELYPEWEPAVVNRRIAAARAAMLVQKGGEGTGGKLGADKIVFSDAKSPPPSGEEQPDGGEPMSDEELQSIWLRQVRTKPADFLRAKFAYQYGTRSARTEETPE